MNAALLQLVRNLFAPLVRAIDSPDYAAVLLADLGYGLPPELDVFGDLQPLLASLSEAIAAIEALEPGAEPGTYLSLLPPVTAALAAAVDAIGGLRVRIEAASAIADFDFGLLDELPNRLLEYLLASALSRGYLRTHAIVRALGIVEELAVAAGPTPFQHAHLRQEIHWDRLGRALGDPLGLVQEVYGWGTQDFDFTGAFVRLAGLGRALGVPSELITARLPFQGLSNGSGAAIDPELARRLVALRLPLLPVIGAASGFELYPILNPSGISVAGLGVGIYLDSNPALELVLSDEWRLRFNVVGGTTALPSLAILPGIGVEFVSDIFGVGAPGRTDFDVAIEVIHEVPGNRLLLLGNRGATRLDAGAAAFRLRAAGTANDAPDLEAGLRLVAAELVVDAGEADGFLVSLLPRHGLVVPFELGLGFSARHGLRFEGSAGLATRIDLHVSIGPIELDGLDLRFLAGADALRLELGATGTAALGPIETAVERVGLLVGLHFQPGNLGPVDLALAFKPPNGLGLAIDAGPITGGGFIAFDELAGRYSGVIELDLAGVGVSAIGVLDTRDEAGRPLPPPGFSFLLVISARFEGLQLGFGFTLNAVGGLVGIHRSMALDALRSGVREGSLDGVMFPEDPIRNMPRILGQLGTFFPPAHDRYVFGPMAEIGWGTPTLFEMEVGVVMELPAPVVVALLGQINVALPTPETDIVALHLAILGVLDTGKKLLSIDASLYDSRIALFSVSGDMALRLAWGDPPNFALAIGGLNPGFQPPPGFPVLRRVSVDLGLGDNPRISLQGYLAVTSNSIQFGASAEIYAAAWELNVYGWLKFDALVVFDPFFFSFEFSVGFALRWGDATFAGIALSGLVSGPSPFHIRGRACVSILFFDICVGFDVTLGERQPVLLPEKDPWPLLKEAIEAPGNWSAAGLPGLAPAVRLRELAGSGGIVVPPMGELTMRQKVLPLGSRLDKFGEFRIPGEALFAVESVRVGPTPVAWEPVQDYFAPGQFEALSNAQKLSEKSFEKMNAGVRLSGTGVATGRPDSVRIASVRYDTSIVDVAERAGRRAEGPILTQAAQLALSGRGAKARSALRGTGAAKYAGPRRAVRPVPGEDEYGIADTEARVLQPGFGTGLSKPLARQRLEAHLVRHPEDRGYLQIIPLAELEAEA